MNGKLRGSSIAAGAFDAYGKRHLEWVVSGRSQHPDHCMHLSGTCA